MNAPKDSHPGDGDKTDSPRAEASPCPDAPEPMAEPHPEAGAVHAFAGMDFVWVPPGTFLMGSPLGEEDRYEDEVQHQVAIPEGFWLGKTQVSQAQWKAVTRSHPSEFQGNDLPVECVNWNDCRGFIQKLNAKSEGVFRLPTVRAAQGQRRAIASATINRGSANTPGRERIQVARRNARRRKSQTLGASMTCTATSGNGARIGTTPGTTPSRRWMTRRDLPPATSVSSVAARGAIPKPNGFVRPPG